MTTWRISRRLGAWPHWPLIEDVEADYLDIEDNGQRHLILYREQLVLGRPRDVALCRLLAADVIAVEPVCAPAIES